ncbi:MAG: rRNA pseudouridine synthase [Gallionella sp.]
MSISIRLSKRLIELVSCSRREAELYIAGGWVSVDGQVVEQPQFMVDEEKVELHPDATLAPIVPVTILFNQPADAGLNPGDIQNLISVDTQTADDHSGIRPLKQHLFKLMPSLQLERTAGGFSVFSQDWHVSRKLTADAATIEQEYVVEVEGDIIENGLKQLNHGLSFNGKLLAPAKVSWQNERRLRFALKGIQPGQIVHMCLKVGLQVVAMKRLRIGRVSMGKLPSGSWRYLNAYERF